MLGKTMRRFHADRPHDLEQSSEEQQHPSGLGSKDERHRYSLNNLIALIVRILRINF
jgi:hypothetical protein